jgi:DNA modification methylase
MAIAAMREGRHFIGFELNEEYFAKAVERIVREREAMAAVMQQQTGR